MRNVAAVWTMSINSKQMSRIGDINDDFDTYDMSCISNYAYHGTLVNLVGKCRLTAIYGENQRFTISDITKNNKMSTTIGIIG